MEFTQTAGEYRFNKIDGTRHATIDSSGRLLVGRSSIGTSDATALSTQFTDTAGTNAIHQFGQFYTNYRTEAAGIHLGRHGGTTASRAVIADTGAGDGIVLGTLNFRAYSPGGGAPTFHLAAQIQGVVDGNLATNSAPGALVFLTHKDWATSGNNATERMRLTAAGNVGIGTDNPLNPLHTKGSSGIRMESSSQSNAMQLIAAGPWGSSNGGDGGLQLNAYDSTGNARIQHTMRRVSSAANGDTVGDYPYEWWASNADGGLNFRMKLNRKGLGIGTQNPRHQLECVGSGHFGGSVIVGDSYGNRGIFGANADLNSDPGVMHFSCSNINTTNSGYIRVASGNTGNDATKGHIDLVAGHYGPTNMDGKVRVYTGANGNQLRTIVDETGNMGINVADPQQKLHVSGTSRFGGVVELENVGSDPTEVDGFSHIYAKDVSSSSEVFVQDQAGNVTQISPHDENGEWIYNSKNIKTKIRKKIRMEKLIRKLEEFFGEEFIEEILETA